MKITFFRKKWRKINIRSGFFNESGNRCEKSDPKNPYIGILDQNFIAFSSKVIGLKSMQNFGHVGISVLKTPAKFGSDPRAPSEVIMGQHHFPETSFHRIVVLPKRHVVECQLVESSYCRIVK